MFEKIRAVELENLYEITRAKKCRKVSFRKKVRSIDPVCVEQNALREYLGKTLPEKIVSVNDSHYGVDFEYRGITLDQKFSFGCLGENTIKIRVKDRKLHNNSDWTMIVNKDWETEFFETRKLALFVKKNWGLVQKRLVEKKLDYSCYAIRLNELYTIEKITPIRSLIEKTNISNTLDELVYYTNSRIMDETIVQENTVLNSKKLVCFEPKLALLAKQILGGNYSPR
jgi:hypothetical protein